MKFVMIMMGSKDDYEVMVESAKILEKFGVNHELMIASAYRSPRRTQRCIKDAQKRGAKVFITADGMATHLAGVVASLSTTPVVRVPMKDDILHMPPGMPVATVVKGKTGAVNGAYLAMQILAIEDKELRVKLLEDRILKAKKVESDSNEIEVRL